MKEVKDSKIFNCKLYYKGLTEYTIKIQPKANVRTINLNDIEKNPLTKQFNEILIQDILHANPNLDFYKGLFVLKNQKKVIKSEKNGSVNFYPGYITSLIYVESGIYLNITIKNKILSTDTILDYMEYYEYEYKENHEEIKKYLIGRTFKVLYARKNYLIFYSDFPSRKEKY